MKSSRRTFLKTAGSGALAASLARRSHGQAAAAGAPVDVAVVGAGVFGAWTAWHLLRAGLTVTLVDAFGPGNSRASSGGETRVTRAGYGPDELYTRWAHASLAQWKALAERAGGAPLFHETGVLWMARGHDPIALATLETLARVGIRHERLERKQLEARWPQIDFGPVSWAIHEPAGGALMARRAVQAVAREVVARGGELRVARALAPQGGGRVGEVALADGARLRAGAIVFALGPWLGKVFPGLLGERIFPTRQEVFYFGPPAGDSRFAPPAFPTWIDFGEEIYGIPDIEAKGFKVAPDRHGPAFDPDSGDRRVTPETLAAVREFVSRRFPALADAPLVASEVCQYENSSNGDFLIDRHPDFANVWLVGGGSGHGFKHGPALGEYVAARVKDGGSVLARFGLATKDKVQKREVH